MTDAVHAALVLLAAFLLASFPARNSDVWRHLATGRALGEGAYQFGVDPFAYTTAEAYWVNHAWLYDALAHGAYRLAGGEALGLLKALLAAVLAGVMLRTAWRGPHGWLAVPCVALAVLALGAHLELRPTVLSYLFLGLTLWWLERTRPGVPTVRACVPLLLLFALWVNMDEWFLLGPLTVGLYAFGGLLGDRPEAGGFRALGLACAAGFAVCLLNPHFARAFTLPEGLTPASLAGVGEDLSGREPPGSPFRSVYLQIGSGLTPAGVAYFPLVLLGLLSFAVNPQARRSPRALVWLAFFLLSTYRSAAVPFFAVVAGPITALNLQPYAARRSSTAAEPGRAAFRARAVSLLAVVALVLTAWPGWLQGFPSEPRRWAVEGDPSLRQLAVHLPSWRAAGNLGPGSHGFNFAPAIADYCAWFGPAEKGFCDGRPHLFPREVVADFVAVRQGLSPEPSAAGTRSGEGGRRDWRDILREHKVTHLIAYDSSERRLGSALRQLFSTPDEWTPLALHGRAVVFAWHDPARPDAASRVAVRPLDLQRRAFHPARDQKAPDDWPGRPPQPRTWWDAFRTPRLPADVNRGEAFVYLVDFDAQRPAFRRAARALWENGLAAAMAGSATSGNGVACVPVAWVVQLPVLQASIHKEAYPPGRDDGPPGLLLSAVRTARRGLHANPDDPAAHFWLGRAYLWLLRNTGERAAVPTFALLDRVRKVQAITAFKHAVLLKQDLVPAHQALAELYDEMGAGDLALQHLEEQLRYVRGAGPKPGEPRDLFARRLGPLEDLVAKLGKRVRTALNLYETQAFNLDALGRARAAENAGLPGKALELLLKSRYEEFGIQGAMLELNLLLLAGRPHDVRESMEPEQEAKLGRAEYRWLQAQLGAATGDYARADDDLRLLAPPVLPEAEFHPKGLPLRKAPALVGLLAGEFLLTSAQGVPFHVGADRTAFLRRTGALVMALRRQAEIVTLRGVLALEWGESTRAEELFRESLALWNTDTAGASALARHLLGFLEGGKAGR